MSILSTLRLPNGLEGRAISGRGVVAAAALAAVTWAGVRTAWLMYRYRDIPTIPLRIFFANLYRNLPFDQRHTAMAPYLDHPSGLTKVTLLPPE